MRHLLAGFGLLLTIQSAFAGPAFPVGVWYSEQKGPSEYVYSISHYEPGGSFLYAFRECWVGGSRDHIETGHWSMTANRMHEIMESIAGKPVHLTTDYDVSRDGTLSIIRLVGGDGLRAMGHMVRRLSPVAEGSTLPSCNPGS